MFPGVALPFGQVKLGIDTSVVNLDQGGISSANSGYTPRGNSTGFSLLHTSGTGGRTSPLRSYYIYAREGMSNRDLWLVAFGLWLRRTEIWRRVADAVVG